MVRIKNPITVINSGGDDTYTEMFASVIARTATEFNDTKGIIKEVGYQGFISCSNLSYVNLPNCKTLDYQAFAFCTNLKNLLLPNCYGANQSYIFQSLSLSELSLPGITRVSNINTGIYYPALTYAIIDDLYLPNCSIASTTLYSSRTYIKNIYLDNLYKISNGITLATNGASLISIYTPILTYVSGNFVSSCTNLKYLNCEFISYISGTGSVCYYCPNLESINFYNLYYLRGQYLFSNCTKLKDIHIYGNNVVALTGTAFTNTPITNSTYLGEYGSIYVLSTVYNSYLTANGWSSLSERIVSVPTENISELYYNKFASDTLLTEIPSQNLNTLVVPVGCFRYCTNLSNISLPECKIIGTYAFSSCTNLSNINLPNCLIIEPGAFYDCSNLTNLSLTTKLYYIGISAFYNCINLSKIQLNNGAGILSTNAFTGCTKLRNVTILSTTITTLQEPNVFQNTPISNSTYLGYFGSIYVPASLVNEYKIAMNWSRYADRITAYIEP